MGWTDYIPGGPSIPARLWNKDFKGAAKAFAADSGGPVGQYLGGRSDEAAGFDLGGGNIDVKSPGSGTLDFGAVGDYLERPYEDKKQGLAEIQNKIAQLKTERLGRKEDLYNRASAAYEPNRQAMQSVYGDPRQWKL